MPSATSPARAALVATLGPFSQEIARLCPQDADTPAASIALVDALRAAFPTTSDAVTAVGHALRQGIEAGTLCTTGEPLARFSRISKPSEQTHDLSVDVVSLQGPARGHAHPHGEVTLGFAATGSDPQTCRFDDHRPGWVFMPPRSRHIPTVTGGRMILVYWLPSGAVEWDA